MFPTYPKKRENPLRSNTVVCVSDVDLTNENDDISKTSVNEKCSTSSSKYTENISRLKRIGHHKSGKDKDSRNSTLLQHTTGEPGNKSIASTSTVATENKRHNYKSLVKIPRKTKEWRPFLDHEYQKYRKKYRLETNSVIICDLQSFKSVFHGADVVDPSTDSFPSTVQLNHHMVIAPEKVRMIQDIESTKRYAVAKDLNKMLAINQKERRLQERKKAVPVVPSSGKSDDETYKNMDNARKKQLEAERERRKRRKSMSSDDANSPKKNKRNRRRLASSSSDRDCVATKKSKPAAKEEKLKKPLNRNPRNEKKIKPEEVKIPLKFVPIAHLLQAKVRRTAKDVPSSVPLCVPKMNAEKLDLHSNTPQTTYYLSDISTDVVKLLNTDTVIEMPSEVDCEDLYDTTVRKMVWWFLKCEQDPAPNEKIHPELHDEVYELDGYESDTSSMGHVSDPEGIHKPVFDPKAIIDPDKKDEYCGLHSIETQIRSIPQGPPSDTFSNCFKIKPGTNYDSANFTIKCHICDLNIRGPRELGAHIRNGEHANNFRNRSLSLAAYEELFEERPHEKVYAATLKDYEKDSIIIRRYHLDRVVFKGYIYKNYGTFTGNVGKRHWGCENKNCTASLFSINRSFLIWDTNEKSEHNHDPDFMTAAQLIIEEGASEINPTGIISESELKTEEVTSEGYVYRKTSEYRKQFGNQLKRVCCVYWMCDFRHCGAILKENNQGNFVRGKMFKGFKNNVHSRHVPNFERSDWYSRSGIAKQIRISDECHEA